MSTRATSWLAWSLAALCVALFLAAVALQIATNIVAGIFVPGPLPEVRDVRNPFGLEGQPWLADANEVIGLLFPLCLPASASSLLLRYLRSGGRCESR